MELKDLNLMKEEFYGHNLIYVRFFEQEFVFRTLSKKEYLAVFKTAKDKYDEEDMICNIACIYPQDYDFFFCPYAGLPPFVAEQIKLVSGFLNFSIVTEQLERHRMEQNAFVNQCMNLIKAVLETYTYEEMEHWTWDRLMLTVARAEEVAKIKNIDIAVINNQQEATKPKEPVDEMEDEAVLEELKKRGIDPMFYFKDRFHFKKEVVDFPLICGLNWKNRGVVDAIAKQSIHTKPL